MSVNTDPIIEGLRSHINKWAQLQQVDVTMNSMLPQVRIFEGFVDCRCGSGHLLSS